MPGARPANSSTRRPFSGGGDGILIQMLGYPIQSV